MSYLDDTAHEHDVDLDVDSADGRFAPEAFLDTHVTSAEERAMAAVRACLASGAAFVEVAPGESYAARQSLEHHAMMARLSGDLERARQIAALPVRVALPSAAVRADRMAA